MAAAALKSLFFSSFDKAIRKTMEGGLVEFWKYRTWVRMKEESRKEMEPIKIEEIVCFA